MPSMGSESRAILDAARAPVPPAAHTHPRNLLDQYFPSIREAIKPVAFSHVPKEGLNCCAARLKSEISSIKGKR